MNRITRTAPLIVLGVLLTACSPGSDPDPVTPDDPGSDETPCVVGTWQLDVPDYGAQSEAYLVGIGIPITEFDMTGAGTIQFTPDGLVATDISLTTTGVLVAGDVAVPISVPSAYTATGDWSTGSDGDTIDLANWASVPDPDVPIDPEAPPIPTIDYTDVESVTADCTADGLVLQAPGAPLGALWHR
jgi:hypothetical protein